MTESTLPKASERAPELRRSRERDRKREGHAREPRPALRLRGEARGLSLSGIASGGGGRHKVHLCVLASPRLPRHAAVGHTCTIESIVFTRTLWCPCSHSRSLHRASMMAMIGASDARTGGKESARKSHLKDAQRPCPPVRLRGRSKLEREHFTAINCYGQDQGVSIRRKT